MSIPEGARMMLGRVALAGLLLIPACAERTPGRSADYLYLWTAAADSTEPDYLAVLEVTEDSVRYGRLVTTLAVPGRQNGPHHTEHEMPADGLLFANGFPSGRTFIFDLTQPATPHLVGQFGDIGPYTHPHSFLRLPGGNVLATYQMQHDAGRMVAGGLVELTPMGQMIRSSSANYPGADSGLRVYSAAVVPALDRIVTTTSDMMEGFAASRQLQIWRLSDLALLHTFPLPAGDEGLYTAEPRLLDDGKTVLVSTFSCGLYLIEGLDTDAPSGRLVASFPQMEGASCAIPVVSGDYYLVTVPAWNAVVSLDISDPAAPREVGRVTFGPEDIPHWISISPDQRRVVVTGYGAMRHRVLIVLFDPATGQLTLDQRFREEGSGVPGFSLMGVPHGAVFSRGPAAPGRPQ